MSQDKSAWFWPEDQFIARMKRERQRRQWSQQRLSDAVEEVTDGRVTLHPTAFTKLEREEDRRNLRLNEAYYIAQALQTSLTRMLSNDDQLTPAERLRGIQERVSLLHATRDTAINALRFITEQIAEHEQEIASALEAEAEVDREMGTSDG